MSDDDKYVIHGGPSSVPIPDGMLGEFIYNSLRDGNGKDVAMVDVFTGCTLTYEQLFRDTCNLAQALRKYGCKQGTVISVCSENSLSFFVPVIATLYLGATVAPINHAYTEHELHHVLSINQPKIIFCSSLSVQKFLTLQKQLKFIEKVVIMGEGTNSFGVENISRFVGEQLNGILLDPCEFKVFKEADPSDNVAFILSSSGTTGLPKGVMSTDKNFLVRIVHSREEKISSAPLVGNVSLGLMPFFHGFGLNVTLGSIVNREKVAVFQRFDEDIFLKTLQDYKISAIGVAPVLAAFLAKSPKVDKYDLSSLQEILCGAAPMSKELENALKKRLKISSTRQAYGLTESTLAVTMMKRGDPPKPGSSGSVVSNTSIKVRDPETGRTLGPNQVGEICLKGLLIMKGYYRNPQATAETFTEDGWLRTGDLGYYDEDEFFFIIDRLKELIKYKGFQVAPAELEAILLNHPKVLDVGVVGAPDENVGELPVAFVVKKPGMEVTEQELIETVNKKVSPHKRLRGGVVFVNAIPKNPSGKILRRELRKIIPHSKIRRESKL
ncbi:unnamed protein product [Phyllotreta striolata]|uniref:Uncharacterized protein n=1 Tax=Phyllotreta striolata TaxID=444603 RepID=A0A9N9TUI0_PHYSR|nr:unnamed protein product [Phyllotreta striolata]